MTKEVFAKGVSKAVPIIGGVVSGGITFATLRPMGMRLVDTLEEAHFTYSKADFESDWSDIMQANEVETDSEKTVESENMNPVLDKIQRAKEMLDDGVLTAEEFSKIKDRLISEM